MQIVRSTLQLLLRLVSERKIAKELKISRNTVRKYDSLCKASSFSYKQLLSMDDSTLSEVIYPDAVKPVQEPAEDSRLKHFEAKLDYFISELKRDHVSKLRLWEEYIEHYPDGYRYTQFCERIRRHQKIADASMHMQYKPAELVMIDFAGDKLYLTDRQTGELTAVPVLVCVLPFSGYCYVEALSNASLSQLVKGLNNCLRYFGGAPMSLVTDNMRQMVTRACKYEPIFTAMILGWAQHNNIRLVSTRVRSPRDKPHVENEVKIAYSRIYAPMRNKVFHSLEELNKEILRHLKAHNKKALQKKQHSRLELFTAGEQPMLQSLPSEPYVMKNETQATVQRDYHVFVGEDKHHYSVPYSYIGKRLRVIYDTDWVDVYLDFKRIARHRRSYKPYGYTTNIQHMPDAHKSYHEQMGWDKDYFMLQASKIGPYTRQYMERMIDSKAIKEHAYKACKGILQLTAVHSHDRLEAACRLAMQSTSTTYRTIANILVNNRDMLESNTLLESFQLPNHENLRGSNAYN